MISRIQSATSGRCIFRQNVHIVFGLLLGCIVVANAPMQISAFEDQPEHLQPKQRTWTDSTGKFKLKATFVEYANGKVVLEKPDRQLVEIDQKKMSSRDRQYVANHLRRVRGFKRYQRIGKGKKAESQPDVAKKEEPKPEEKSEDKLAKQTDKDAEIVIDIDSQDLPKPKSMYGIDWYKSADVASKVAANKDKAIMWFRVLGDLEGFM